jgi:hypothetical protein
VRAKRIPTFEATWRPAGGRLRVVLVREAHGGRALVSTDPTLTAEAILTAADRLAVEIAHAQYPSSNILPDRRRAG